MIKAPKIYFYDTGIACNLLGITSTKALSIGSFRGPLFENLIISELEKYFFNIGRRPPLYFWRDKNGRIEIDCVIDLATTLVPIEIKASETISLSFFSSMLAWNIFSHTKSEKNIVIYSGNTNQTRNFGRIISWHNVPNLMHKLYKKP